MIGLEGSPSMGVRITSSNAEWGGRPDARRLVQARARARDLQRGARGRARRARARRRAHDRHRAPAPRPRRGRRARAAQRLPGGVRVEGDLRGFRVAVCADALVNPEPGGLDALAVCERTGFGVMQLPATWYPDDVAAGWLEQVAEQLDEYLRRGYAVVLVTLAGDPRAPAQRDGARRCARRDRPRPAARVRERRRRGRARGVPARAARARRRGVSAHARGPRRARRRAGRRARGRRADRGRADRRRDGAGRGAGGRRDRRARLHRPARRRRRARARRPRLPPHGRQHRDLGRPLRGRLARRGGGRHDDDHRLRDAGRGRGPAGAARAPPERHPRRAPSTSRCTAGCSRPTREALREIPELVARGVPSLKVFLAYSQLGEPMRGRGPARGLEGGGARPAGSCRRTARAGRSSARGSRRRSASGATGLRGFRGLASAASPRPTPSAARSRSAAASGAETYCVHLSTSGAVEHLRLARMHGLDGARRVLPAPPAAGRVALPRRARRRLRHEPAAAHAPSTAPRSGPALAGRHARGRGRRSRRLARAHQGARARASSRPCTAPRATACCCRCWPRRSGGSRASAGSTSRASPPRTRRASSACPTRARSRPGRHADLVVLHPGDVAARAAGAALLAGRQRHLPRPPARAAARRPAARPRARARRRRSSASPRPGASSPAQRNARRGHARLPRALEFGGSEC